MTEARALGNLPVNDGKERKKVAGAAENTTESEDIKHYSLKGANTGNVERRFSQ